MPETSTNQRRQAPQLVNPARRDSFFVGLKPPKSTPTASGYALQFHYHSTGRYPCRFLQTPSDSLRPRRHAPTLYRLDESAPVSLRLNQPAKQLIATTGGSRSLRARRVAPLTSFSGHNLSVALNRNTASGGG